VVDQLQRTRSLGAVEDTLAAAQDYREAHQDQPVDQPGGKQRRVEGAAALDEQVAAFALLELSDGVGGAAPAGDSGLRGLRDRVAALGGQLAVASPAGGGTVVEALLPLAWPEDEDEA